MKTKHLHKLKEACMGAVGKADHEKYLPLWLHAADTAGVIEHLIRETLADHQLEILCEKIPGENLQEKQEILIRNAVFLALVHDIGKLTSGFQSMICHHLSQKPAAGFPLKPWKRRESVAFSHHPATGMGILTLLDYPAAFAEMTGAHHGLAQKKVSKTELNRNFNTDHELIKYLYGENSQKTLWQQAWKKTAQAALAISGAESADDLAAFSLQGEILLCGLLIMADWVASDEKLFPLLEITDEGSPDKAEKRVKEGMQSFGNPDLPRFKQSAMTDEEFKAIFSFAPNPVQSAVLEIFRQTEDPGLMIIESQMGSGKTEAALGAAVCLNTRKGCNGIMMALPTQSSANGLYPRFVSWAQGQTGEGKYTLRLAHGKAQFNQDYALLELNSSVDSDSNDHLLVHEWTRKPKTALMADFVLGTVDQCLSAALNRKHMMLRHLGLAKKTVIIDEVHAYDAYMMVYLFDLLEWLGSYHIPAVLLSATLPQEKKNELIRSYQKGLGIRSTTLQIPESNEYPRITWTDGEQVQLKTVHWETENKTIEVEASCYQNPEDEFSKIRDSLKKHLKDGGCAAVLVNTVEKAQKLGIFLENELDQEVLIFHSQFTDGDRARIEKEVLRRAGKDSGSDERNGLVVVGTQVIEQSIDADFDFMITELAPADLLLQRAGRLHRHLRKRPESVKSLELEILIGPDEEYSVYDDWLMLQTRKHLPKTIHIPQDITELVNQVYGDSQPETDRERKLKEQYRREQAQRKSDAKGRALLRPGDRPLNGLMKESADLARSDSVRQESDSREVILLERQEDGLFTVPGDHAERLNPDQKLSRQQMELLRSASIRIRVKSWWSREFDSLSEETDVFFSKWKEDGAFRAEHFLILEPDADGPAFSYSKKIGLQEIDEKSVRK